MSVNRYKIAVSNLTMQEINQAGLVNTVSATATTINLPINLDFQEVGQCEVVDRNFVEVETENSINPIIDYEKVRVRPVDSSNNKIDDITYNVILLDSPTFPTISHYGDIGFVYDDVKFRKNKFTRTFLRFSFYDSDIPTDQMLVSFISLFSEITEDILDSNGLPLPVNSIPIRFKLSDPISNPRGQGEGYHLYHFKDEITAALPKELFMRASFNNAKNGTTINLTTSSVAKNIDELIGDLHTKYILKRINDSYVYEVDATYSTNVSVSGNDLTINLYQIQAI